MNGKSFVRSMHNIIMAVCVCALTAAAQAEAPAPAGARAADEAAARENVRQMEAGWNAKSGERFAAPFAEDADYVIVNGLHIRGRQHIAEGHQRIFDTIYKTTTLSLAVKQVRFLRADVAVVHVAAVLSGQAEPPHETAATITLLMTREAGAWRIAAFQNTRVAR